MVVPAGRYKNRQLSAFLVTNHARRLGVQINYRGGSFFDGTIQSTNVELVFKPTPRLHLSAAQSIDRVDVPDGSFDSLISTVPPPSNNMLSWNHSGFSADASVRVETIADAVRIGRYMIRSPIVLERLNWDDELGEVTYQARRTRRERFLEAKAWRTWRYR